MSQDPATLALPPFRVLQVALRSTTEALATAALQPGSATPAWSEFEWNVARAVATIHGVSALLAKHCDWNGPPRWQSFLRSQVEHGLRREARADALLERIGVLARQAGVGMLALKGAALRPMQIYSAGTRPMADIDLLVRPRDCERAIEALARLGYRETVRNARNVELHDDTVPDRAAFGENVASPLKIEVHTRIFEVLAGTTVDITRRLAPTPLIPGLHGYPDLAACMAHLLLHAAGNMQTNTLRLIQIFDIARLAARMNSGDWARLIGTRDEGRPVWWAYPPLWLAQRYCAASLPAGLMEELRAPCQWLLARRAERYTLTDVSLSNLSIRALPGIEWARTPADVLRFAHSRVMPSRGELAGLPQLVKHQPQFASVPWYSQPHAVRILRWIFTRPPRVQTLSTVCAALASGAGGTPL